MGTFDNVPAAQAPAAQVPALSPNQPARPTTPVQAVPGSPQAVSLPTTPQQPGIVQPGVVQQPVGYPFSQSELAETISQGWNLTVGAQARPTDQTLEAQLQDAFQSSGAFSAQEAPPKVVSQIMPWFQMFRLIHGQAEQRFM